MRYTLIPLAGLSIAASRAAALAYTGSLIDSVNTTGLLNVMSQLNMKSSSSSPEPRRSAGFIVIYPMDPSPHGFCIATFSVTQSCSSHLLTIVATPAVAVIINLSIWVPFLRTNSASSAAVSISRDLSRSTDILKVQGAARVEARLSFI